MRIVLIIVVVVVVTYDYFFDQHGLYVSLFIECELHNIPGTYKVRIWLMGVLPLISTDGHQLRSVQHEKT